MNVAHLTNDEALRAEVRAWLDTVWDAEARAPRTGEGPVWLRTAFDAGWLTPGWPAEWFGRGFSPAQGRVVNEEFARVGAPGSGRDRVHLAANTVLTHGRDAVRHELVPKLVTDELSICLLYSEPGAGSDLAAVRTRAELNDGQWVINGQKIWTSGAMTADCGFLVCRTDWNVPKHQGISFILLPMKQPGVEVRPLHQVTGESHFNEVFLTDAVAPEQNLLGEMNQGWKVLQTALAYERLLMGENNTDRRSAFARQTEFDLVALARHYGVLDDPTIRQDVARAMAYRQVSRLNVDRAKEDQRSGGSSPLMSLGKLAMSRVLHEEARVMTAILGSASLLDGPEYPDSADLNFRLFNAYKTSIGGGTDQIQRNIISERVLGLPREIEVDRNIPFREVRAG